MRVGLLRAAAYAVGLLVALAVVAVSPAAARAHHPHRFVVASGSSASTVLQWYDITNSTVGAAGFPEPVTGSDAWGISWLAAARAVEQGRGSEFQVAAFAQAVHDALASLVPGQQAALDSDLASTLASVPDGTAKDEGIAAGRSEAASVLAERAHDGLDTASVDTPFTTPPAAPGVWQPTPPNFGPATRSGQGNAQPLLLASDDQFDPGPPPSLTSAKYLTSAAETETFGSSTSAVRTPQQTDVALFWEPAANIQYIQIVRALIADSNHSLTWDTRFVAAFQLVTTDAQIAIYNAKFKYVFWRPVTAIRDGSSGVIADPSWTPLFATPTYPEYPSGHGGYAGAAQQVLTAFVGRHAPEPISVTSPTDPGSTHVYNNWSQLTQEVINARVWEGIHFRFSDQTGARIGREVANWDLQRLGKLGL